MPVRDAMAVATVDTTLRVLPALMAEAAVAAVAVEPILQEALVARELLCCAMQCQVFLPRILMQLMT